jgi:hypothetical protein
MLFKVAYKDEKLLLSDETIFVHNWINMIFVGRLGVIKIYSTWRGEGEDNIKYLCHHHVDTLRCKILKHTLITALFQNYIYSLYLWQQTNYGVLVFYFWQQFHVIQWSAFLNFKYITVNIHSRCPHTISFQSKFSATMSTIAKEIARYGHKCAAALPECRELRAQRTRSHGLEILPDSCMTLCFIRKTDVKLRR